MTADVPPIVLLVDSDRGMLDRYSRELEEAGMWVAATAVYDELIASAEDLRPDVIIADTEGQDNECVRHTLDTVRRHPDLSATPLVVLVPQQGIGAPDADLALRKPVPPEFLLRRTQEVLARGRKLRSHSNAIVSRSRSLLDRSNHLVGKAAAIAAEIDGARRACPNCSGPLDWVERGTIGGVAYDYYRWCPKGCGLYCFNCRGRTWIRLA